MWVLDFLVLFRLSKVQVKFKFEIRGCFHLKSPPPYFWTKTKCLSVAYFIRSAAVVHFPIVIHIIPKRKSSLPRQHVLNTTEF